MRRPEQAGGDYGLAGKRRASEGPQRPEKTLAESRVFDLRTIPSTLSIAHFEDNASDRREKARSHKDLPS